MSLRVDDLGWAYLGSSSDPSWAHSYVWKSGESLRRGWEWLCHISLILQQGVRAEEKEGEQTHENTFLNLCISFANISLAIN